MQLTSEAFKGLEIRLGDFVRVEEPLIRFAKFPLVSQSAVSDFVQVDNSNFIGSSLSSESLLYISRYVV